MLFSRDAGQVRIYEAPDIVPTGTIRRLPFRRSGVPPQRFSLA